MILACLPALSMVLACLTALSVVLVGGRPTQVAHVCVAYWKHLPEAFVCCCLCPKPVVVEHLPLVSAAFDPFVGCSLQLPAYTSLKGGEGGNKARVLLHGVTVCAASI